MYVMTPSRVWREAERSLKITPKKELKEKEPSCDYGVSRHTVEIPFWRATFVDDVKKSVTTAKPGDRLYIEAKVNVEIVNRVVDIEVNKVLYKHGLVSVAHRYRHGEEVGVITWECVEPLDFKKLPWLYEIYIIDQPIK